MYCHKCGSKNDDSAAFCYKCGTQIGDFSSPAEEKAHAHDATSSKTGTPALDADEIKARASSLDSMAIARLAICAIVFISLFLPWLEYKGAISGTTPIHLGDFGKLKIGGYTVALAFSFITMAVGAVSEALTRHKLSRAVFIAGCAIMMVAIILLMLNSSHSATVEGYAIASIGLAPVAWLCLLLSIAGVVSCFWTPKSQ